MIINILDIFKNFYFTKYLMVGITGLVLVYIIIYMIKGK